MKYSINLLQSFFDEKLPSVDVIAGLLTKHSFDVEEFDDTSLVIDVLPNRASDCFAHLGVAREISILTGIKLKDPIVDIDLSFNGEVSVDTKKCSGYMLAEVFVVNGESEEKVKDILNVVDQQSISKIVDFTNFVMLEYGIPIHAFDADKVDGDISVGEARQGDKIVLLDGREVELNEGDVVIKDEKDVLAIGGIKGGKKAEITSDTKKIFIEVAKFDSHAIRTTSRRLNLITESSKRFSQNMPPEMIQYSMNRILELLNVEPTNIKYYRPRTGNRITNISSKDTKILGEELSIDEITSTLPKLGFKCTVVENTRERFLEEANKHIGVPYYYGSSVSYDAPNKFDCSSFINYCALKSGVTIPRMSVNQYVFAESISESDVKPGDLVFSSGEKNHNEPKEENGFKYLLSKSVPKTGIGHCGIIDVDGYVVDAFGKNNLSDVNAVQRIKIDEHPYFSKDAHYVRIFDNDVKVVVEVPLWRSDINSSVDLVEEIARIKGLDMFNDEELPNVEISYKPEEDLKWLLEYYLVGLGGYDVITYTFMNKGELCVQYPMAKDKGCLRDNLSKNIKKSLDVATNYLDWFGRDRLFIFEVGKVYKKDCNEFVRCSVGYVTKNKKDMSKYEEELKNKLAEFGLEMKEINDHKFEGVFEMEVTSPVNYQKSGTPINFYTLKNYKYKQLPKYPYVARDISMFVTNGSTENAIEVIKKVVGDLCHRVTLIDEFEKEGQKSVAFRIIFQSYEKTLNDDEVLKIMQSLESELKGSGYEVR